jgi:acetyl-CoA acetyltransferase
MTPWGNAANAIGLAAMAVATGHANYVVYFHSLTYGHGHTYRSPAVPQRASGERALYAPFGLVSISSWGALYAQRYLHQYNADSDTLGWVAVAARGHGATNPAAIRYGQPLTIEEYRRAPYVVEPFRVPDLNLSNDAACAVVITSAERARDLKQKPAYIMGATSGTGGRFTEHVTSFNRPDLTVSTENQDLMRELIRQTGLGPKDIDAAQIYDHMSIFVLLALEGLGFCGIGEAKDFVKGGQRISLGGELPVNTHGGHLAEAYVNSANHVLEAARQVRGTAANQVADAEFVLVESGNGLPSSALILRR